MALNFLSLLTGSFAMPAAENPTVAMMEAAYRHHRLDVRYINCEVPPDRLADAVRGARAMGWTGFNCSIPHKVAVIEHLDGLEDSAMVIGAVNCAIRHGEKFIGDNTDGKGFLPSLQKVVDPEGSKSSCLVRAALHGRLGWSSHRRVPRSLLLVTRRRSRGRTLVSAQPHLHG